MYKETLVRLLWRRRCRCIGAAPFTHTAMMDNVPLACGLALRSFKKRAVAESRSSNSVKSFVTNSSLGRGLTGQTDRLRQVGLVSKKVI